MTDAIRKHDVWFDPANFEMPKTYQGNFQSLCRLAQLFLNTSAAILQKKERNRLEKIFFPALKMQFLSILLKCREIDVQIQAFTYEN